MKRAALGFWLSLLALHPVLAPATGQHLDTGFKNPPLSARPWVYWFWLNGNISSNGITADLEAMKRVGIGGVLIMEVDQGAPVGPVDFMSARWRGLFKHVVAESRRLGLEVNLNNDAGWNGSGGPWIRPEQSMQKVVFSETNVAGPCHFEAVLPKPEILAGYYEDIGLLAFPKLGSYRIPDIKTKAAYDIGYTGPFTETNLTPEMLIERSRQIDLTSTMADGRIAWDVPAGEWTLLRIGHTCTGVENAPAPKSGRGLECDKLSKAGIEANFAGMMGKLAADNGLSTAERAGKDNHGGLVATHIDSWENGSQNWTAKMREEFQSRRGYDLWPFLPVLSGRVVESAEVSARFLWDFRRTISELVVENYAGRMRELAHEHGMRFTVEAYGSPCDVIPYGGEGDEPMGEFWSPSGAMETCKGMASAAHVYGKTIIGAEAFTAGDKERWREYPGSLKALGDQAFCEGINRFVFHRYALQPWSADVRPGMMMGPWGQHYERTETWWDQSPAWHQYLARCQYLLRQGHFVADLCYLQDENPPHGVGQHRRAGYDYDECGAEVVLNRMSVKDGLLVLPDGMHYRLLVLPDTSTMTPALLRKITDLVGAGATILGAPPRKSPSLSNYPECDLEVKRVSAALWGDCDGDKHKEFRYGKGRVVRGLEPERVLRDLGVPPDFSSDVPLKHIHRSTEGADIYFVANPNPIAVTTVGAFRVSGRVPELWWPKDGRTERAAVFDCTNGVTRVVLPLDPSGSLFVVFRSLVTGNSPVVSIDRNGKDVVSATPHPIRIVVRKASYGVAGDETRTRDVREEVQHKADAGDTSFVVRTLIENGDPAPEVVKTLTVSYTIDDRSFSVRAEDPETIHLTADVVKATVRSAIYGVLDDPKRTRDVKGRLQRLLDAGEISFSVARMADGDDPALGVIKTLKAECEINGKIVPLNGTDPELIDLRPALVAPERIADVCSPGKGRTVLEVWKPGHYEVALASGGKRVCDILTQPPILDVDGAWQLHFAPGRGAPAQVTLDRLSSWSEHADPGIKYFSGTCTYSKTIDVPRLMLAKSRRLILNLGRVEVMARVKLNGKDLGCLWTAPFEVDITKTARPGANRLEVQVVNLWPNRLIGDEQMPEDSDRNPDGTLKSWPAWLLAGQPSPSGRFTFSMWRLWKKDDQLLPSGLLGPVTLRTAELIPLSSMRRE
ncbi:MAG TPA: glycosyl hydrolase [Verrucomicrobiae bacterium]|nr:glycosyl hydrolase [Verrucomicrobiae bacterium]